MTQNGGAAGPEPQTFDQSVGDPRPFPRLLHRLRKRSHAVVMVGRGVPSSWHAF